MCRITAYIPHPRGIFYNKATSSSDCLLLDSVISFFLWLLNRDYEEDLISLSVKELKRAIPDGAPLKLLSAYRRQEKREGRIIQRVDYDASFWAWTQRYLSEEFAATVVTGIKSVAEAVNDKLNSRRSQG